MHSYVLSVRLTSGQITFIFRVVVQILAFGGMFLLGLIILGITPRVAQLHTHDVLNRIVGKSTTRKSTFLWIKNRLFNKEHDPTYRFPLLFAFILSLSYGLLVSLSDVGLIGLQTCSIPFSPITDFPASVRSESDARALVLSTMVNGTNPTAVKSIRCNFAQATAINRNETFNQCTSWNNSTYSDASAFSSLNLTDTDALMFQSLAGPQSSKEDGLPVYYFGPMGRTEEEAKINAGLAVVPHSTGVRMIVGTPNLSKNQSVSIPKSVAVEVSFGCLPVGIVVGMMPSRANARRGGFASIYFVPDPIYNTLMANQYVGPDHLFQPLTATAQKIRQRRLAMFNQSSLSDDGYFNANNTLMGYISTWRTQVSQALLATATIHIKTDDLLADCGDLVHGLVNVTASKQSLPSSLRPGACSEMLISGSYAAQGNITLRSTDMVCASTTEINMVQTALQTNGDGSLSANTTNLPSDLHELRADTTHDTIQRFTLSDNPSGNLRHYILQTTPTIIANQSISQIPDSLLSGSGSVGVSISQLGNAALGTWFDQGTELVVNNTFFTASASDLQTSAMIPKWAGEYVASIMISSFAMNGYVALGKPSLVVESTGGKKAVCYQLKYGAGFIPVVVSFVGILIWALVMLVTSQLRGVDLWEKRYGGLTPAKVTDAPILKLEKDEILRWEHDRAADLHLVHASASSFTLEMDKLGSYKGDGPDERSVLVSTRYVE
ncbi:hypothetical protein CPB83DRAFT_845729 [Crepidotus variabilis]|uniref:Uncharacterized protein n=1 Tax=Crepidotus variabilis TaxID=179855 RepID=A0A9P6EQ28_9AGAR|nr:hypothetical protein CPB83DRAFT_845729 [Crepidotus variabilis]